MNELFKDKEHLVRVAALFAIGFLVFLLARWRLVPSGFGQYGHYRSGALDDNAGRAVAFAGRGSCEGCHAHAGVVEARKGSKHEKIGCEACHGPLAAHAADPAGLKPQKPDGRTLCLMCHLENAAKPQGFPQVNPKDHGDAGPCTACHKPHHPEVA